MFVNRRRGPDEVLARLSLRVKFRYPSGSTSLYYAEVQQTLAEVLRHLSASRPGVEPIEAWLVFERDKTDLRLAKLDLEGRCGAAELSGRAPSPLAAAARAPGQEGTS